MAFSSTLLLASLFAVAGLWLSRVGRVRPGDGADAIVDAALARIADGEKGVRVEAETWGPQARLASGINALIQAHETGRIDEGAVRADNALLRRLRAELDRAGGGDTARTFIAIAEVERFATLRRGIGTQLANRVLRHVSDRIVGALASCEIGRTNRTTIEFAFRSAGVDSAMAELQLLSTVLDQRIELDGYNFDLSIVIGFADSGDQSPREELIDQAAAALAEAQAHRVKVGFADPAAPIADTVDDLMLMRDLPGAMANDELAVHYQPKLRSRTNTVDSAEALLRWFHPERGQVDTARLIELAENTGAIRDVTEWVIARAVADQRRLAANGHDLVIYVNVSGVLLPDAGFAVRALELVADTPGRIGFEITETAVIDDPDGALANLAAFSEAGVKIAIDDYGSGLSSLAYLKQLPANELKIDRLFVSGLTDSHRDPLLVRSSIDLAHALEMEVTAEGVDDPMALSLLRVMGCDMVQGYLISMPLPVDELERFLADTSHLERLAAPTFPQQFGAAVGNRP